MRLTLVGREQLEVVGGQLIVAIIPRTKLAQAFVVDTRVDTASLVDADGNDAGFDRAGRSER